MIQCGACIGEAQELIMVYIFLESCKLKHRRMSNTVCMWPINSKYLLSDS